ncbi:Fe(3+)-hydroxamate ABC transporter permease FhuB [Motilimonas sp. 1_MG-2023]|uniref:Fe(3+)-hydroxamate ABC transporter permease FhuB n=1 Tax=Motilimonas sp. 1_MG-2023 TaxID=3062672 RepID=UPI0026E3A780|nr:Fe(3+)-hydroxamate ABC transporter permease FhuB [Motilimonas sp. 1_MG-2023]MDO6527281.1 Fe(3+)-hydroxamate ABC transporter permease FhuB [Motilimonas sp. 1_MG-2023]
MIIRYTMTLVALCVISFLHLQLGGMASDTSFNGHVLTLFEQSALLFGTPAESFTEINYYYVQLPRWLMGLIVGAMLGLVGSLMQQLTQNPLMSPLTLGTASGAWLALVIINVFFPSWVGEYSAIAALMGSVLTLLLVLAIVGIRNVSGLPIVLAGMTVNILLGAIASAIILLNDQYAKNLFIWGAGDLGQNGWSWLQWLLPKITVALAILLFAPRLLTVLKLGQQGATARGVSVVPMFLGFIAIGLWLVASVITAVGVISFIGLLAPNVARILGARTARDELWFSLMLGAILLCATDSLALWVGAYSVDIIPSGTATAMIGAPALIWIARHHFKAQDNLSISLPDGRAHLGRYTGWLLGACLVLATLLYTLFSYSGNGVSLLLPNEFVWSVRWPRMVTTLAAGAGLAIAGAMLQRLVYNPLASPDLLGISAGATFTLVGSSLLFGVSIHESGPLVAFSGSMLVLALLLLLGKKHQYAPSMLILTGISLTAMIEALVHFALTRGGEDEYVILTWLSGSAYRAQGSHALMLLAVVLVLAGLSISASRWLTLISVGRSFATARGLNVSWAYVLLLSCVAMLCAIVTTTMGPVAFVGLLAPHMAIMLGAKQVKPQLVVAALLGALLMLTADWLGQIVVYPGQISAGILVSIIGGGYFIFLLMRSR